MSQAMVQSSPRSSALATEMEEKFHWSKGQFETFVNTFAKGCTPDEVQLLAHTAKRTGLDPFARQILPVKRWDSKLKKEVMAVQFTIDGFRSIAERTKEYAAGKELWCGPDGVWKDVWLDKKNPVAAKYSVIRIFPNGQQIES